MTNPSNFTEFDESIFKTSISVEWLTVFLLKIMNWNFPGFCNLLVVLEPLLKTIFRS